tara:strand:+ start:33 stop:752 length:720 start_codon:yes stop_codon:yes gene_type:complete
MGKIDNKSSVQNEKYLPISKLDLKVLINEIKKDMNNFFRNSNAQSEFKILLTGRNSSHPNLTAIFADAIKLPTYLISPSGSSLIKKVNIKEDDLLESNFTKLFGLGLALLDTNDQTILNNIDRPTRSMLSFIEYKIPEKQINLLKKKSLTNQAMSDNLKTSDNNEKINSTKSNLETNEFKDKSEENINDFNLKLSQKQKDTNPDNKNSTLKKENKEQINNNEAENKSKFKLDTDFLDLD